MQNILFIVEVLVVHMPFKVYNFNRKRFSVVVVPHLFQLFFGAFVVVEGKIFQ